MFKKKFLQKPFYWNAEGYETTMLGGSHAEGYETTPFGGSHAEGYETTTLGDYCHAEGHEIASSKMYSHTEELSNSQNTRKRYKRIGNAFETEERIPKNNYVVYIIK